SQCIRSTRYFACVAASKPRDLHASNRRSISLSPSLDGATEVFRSRAMVRRFLPFRTSVASERYGLIASEDTIKTDGIVVRDNWGTAAPRCTRRRGSKDCAIEPIPGYSTFETA